MGWTIPRLAEVIYTATCEDDNEEELKKFTETLKKQLKRKTTQPEKLQEYLNIIIQDPDFQKLSLVVPYCIPNTDIDDTETIYLSDISKEITIVARKDIEDPIL